MKTPDNTKKGLECCTPRWDGHKWVTCNIECPYITDTLSATCRAVLCEDALTYIRQLEAKLAEYEKPLEPLPEEQIYNDPVWLEMRADNVEPMIADIVPSFTDPGEKAEITLLGNPRRAHLPYDHYGSSWRCWSRRPTDEERKAAKWDD